MNLYFAVAGCLAIILGLVHSVFGEFLIFRGLDKGDPISITGSASLSRRHIRILRVTWHVTTVFGWGLGAVLVWLSFASSSGAHLAFVENTATLSFLTASLLTLFGTKGRHPGWIVLLSIAILLWLG